MVVVAAHRHHNIPCKTDAEGNQREDKDERLRPREQAQELVSLQASTLNTSFSFHFCIIDRRTEGQKQNSSIHPYIWRARVG